MGRRKKHIQSYLYYQDEDSNFAMITSDLLSCSAFINLSHAARLFYIELCVYKNTVEQSQKLYVTLKDYYSALGIEKPEIDLKTEAGQNPKIQSKKFVAPEKAFIKDYGYTKAYITKLKKTLIDEGFIKVYANGKGVGCANPDYSTRYTIYEFVNDWKKK